MEALGYIYYLGNNVVYMWIIKRGCHLFLSYQPHYSREIVIYGSMQCPCLLDLGKDESWILVRLGISYCRLT
jgi:hypothetical protein